MSLPQSTAGGALCLRRSALAAVLALSLAPLAACATGGESQTLQVQPDNAATKVGAIQIANAVVLTKPGSDGASVSARIFNNGDTKQTIQSVTVGGSAQAKLSDKDGGQTVVVPAHGSVLFGGKGNPSATVSGGAETMKNGDFQKVTFTLSSTGAVSVQAHVLPSTGYYASYGPSESPSPSTSASPTGKKPPSSSASGSAASTSTSTPKAPKGSASSSASAG